MAEIRNKDCEDCTLHIGCNTVCIVSPPKDPIKLMVVVDQPDIDVDRTGDPYFEASSLRTFFDVCEKVVGISKEVIYVSYLNKCRPVDGRKAEAEEVAECLKYLDKEIALVNPTCILTLGSISCKALTGNDSVSRASDIYKYKQVPVVCTYHPNFLTYNPDKLLDFAKVINRAYDMSVGKENNVNISKLKIVQTEQELQELVKYCAQTGESCFDVETTGLSFIDDKLTVVGISFQHGSSWVVPISHFESPFIKNPEIPLKYLAEIFENDKIRKTAWNTKFDVKFFMIKGIQFNGELDDAMLMHHILDENVKHGLKEVSGSIYPETVGYSDEIKTYKWEEVPLDKLAKYCGLDADLTLRLTHYLEYQLMIEDDLYKLYRNLTRPALRTLTKVEYNGMPVDTVFLDECIVNIKTKIEEVSKRMGNYRNVKQFEAYKAKDLNNKTIAELQTKIEQNRVKHGKETAQAIKYTAQLNAIKSGETKLYEGVNFASTKQLGDLLYQDYGFGFRMPYVKKKRSTEAATGSEYLLDLGDRTGFVTDLIELRSMNKTLSTYFEGIKSRLDKNNTIHPSFLIHGTTTGRLSCRDPNMQNIPRTGEFNGLIKKVFKAPEGYTLMACDYSQAELRLVAISAKEKVMQAVYQSGGDIHTTTAIKVLGLTEDDWAGLSKEDKKEFRNRAKAVNFGFIYGMGAKAFVDYAKNSYGVVITEAEAKVWRDNYFDLYPALEGWHKRCRKEVSEVGYVKTLFGRKRRLPDVWSRDEMKQGDAERQAINSPIQGTAGECTVQAMSILDNRLDRRVMIGNTVHDSIMLYVPNDIVHETALLVRDTCMDPLTMEYFGFNFEPVGMNVDIEVGPNWKELNAYNFVI